MQLELFMQTVMPSVTDLILFPKSVKKNFKHIQKLTERQARFPFMTNEHLDCPSWRQHLLVVFVPTDDGGGGQVGRVQLTP